MMRAIYLLISIAVLCGCSDSDSTSEVIVLAASEDVRLVEPDSVVGGAAQYVGVVPAGQSVHVVECRPRKSDIDVIVAVNNKQLVAWEGKYQLSRRAFDAKRDSPTLKTKSCRGLLGC